jgi:excisionase family DNA binding protein
METRLYSEPLLRASDVAARLNISVASAYRMMETGELKVYRCGSKVRVRLCDLEKHIEEHITGG